MPIKPPEPENEIVEEIDEITRILSEIQELENREKAIESQNKIHTMYPNEGKYSRHAYPKHLRFFKSPTKERLFIAGNRCITPWSRIKTSEGHDRCAFEFFLRRPSIQSWDGKNLSTDCISDAFLVGYSPVFRLVLDNGQSLECSADHEILSHQGEFSSLQHIVERTDLTWTLLQPSNCQAKSDTAHHPKAQHIHQDIMAFQALILRLGDFLRLCPWIYDSLGGGEHTQGLGNHPYGCFYPLSNVHNLLVSLFALVSYIPRISLCDDLLRQALHHINSQCPHNASHPPSTVLSGDDRASVFSEISSSLHASLESLLFDKQSGLSSELSQPMSCLPVSVPTPDLSLFSEFQSNILLPSSCIPLFGANIIGIIPMGSCPIMDFSVEKHKCYISSGVVNHNCGKTVSGAYELALHLTGLYPDWWDEYLGYKKFKSPISAWAAGKTNESTRDIIQAELLGRPITGEKGRRTLTGVGMIPKELIGEASWKAGITGLVDTISIKHTSGGWSDLGLKAYAQGSDVFEGTKKHVVWFDEEPPLNVYSEALVRTMVTDDNGSDDDENGSGIIYTTFTPLKGLSETVLRFLPDGEVVEGINFEKDLTVVSMTWDEAPHINEATKKKMYDVLPPNEQEARSKGRPSTGSGLIYPIPEQRLLVDPFEIPSFYTQGYGFDVGLGNTAALWAAHDQQNDIVYITGEYYEQEEVAIVHANNIKARGKWMYGVVDPAARNRNPETGRRLMDVYEDHGLLLFEADNAVDAGIQLVLERMRTGRLKFFSNLPHLLREFRLYRRDDKQRVVKKNDHLMDCLRYLIISGLDLFRPNQKNIENDIFSHLKLNYKDALHERNDYDPS